MGQVRLPGAAAAAALEVLVPGDLQALKPRRMRYTMFTDDRAGILDDIMVTRLEDDSLFVVVNAACKDADLRSEEHTSELQSLMRISYAVFCLKKKITKT